MPKPLEQDQVTKFTTLWQGFHIKKNDSAQAADQAAEALHALDTENFTNTEVATAHGELSRITAVLALSAVKKAKNWEEARQYLLLSLETVQTSYPVAKTYDQAKIRGEYWDPVYGDSWAQLSALMDVLELAKVLVVLYPEAESFAYFRAVHEALFTIIADTEKNREILVLMIKHGEFELAQEAYQEYQSLYGPESKAFSPDQWITLTTLMIGQFFGHSQVAEARKLSGELGKVLIHQKGMSFFGIREFFKNMSPSRGQRQLDSKLIGWYSEGVKTDPDVRKQVEALFDHVFVGVGEEVQYLNTKE